MEIGDKLHLIPTGRLSEDRSTLALPCTVVYIHPQRRFFTVEFRSSVTGETFRESFPCPDRPGTIREQPEQDAADRYKRFGPASLWRGGSRTKG